MIDLIVGNLFSLLAAVCDAVSASRKSAKSVLLVQTLSQAFYGLTGIALKGYSAAVQNAVSILRNLAALKKIESKWVERVLVSLGVILGVAFNNRGFIGLLPVLANLGYSIAVFRFKDNEVALKAAFFVSVFLFCIFNAAILNLVGTVSNVILFVVTGIFLIKAIKLRK